MGVSSKIKILESCDTLVYGAPQTLAFTKNQEKKLQATQRRIKRSILGIKIKGKIKNESIRERTETKDVIYTMKKLKTKYIGPVARQESRRWSKKKSWNGLHTTKREKAKGQ